MIYSCVKIAETEWEIVFFRLLPMATQTYVTDLQAMNPTAVQVGGLGRLDSCTSPSSCGLGFNHTPSMDLWPPLPHLSLRTCQIRLELTAPFFTDTFSTVTNSRGVWTCFLMTSCNRDLRFSRLVVGAWSVLPCCLIFDEKCMNENLVITFLFHFVTSERSLSVPKFVYSY